MINNKYMISIVTVVTGLVFLLGCDRPWTGSIRGTVTVTDTEDGISGVVIIARSLKNSYEVSGVTDGEGKYRLHDARWGPNLVRIYHPRYYTAEKYADVIRDNSVELDFSVKERPLYMDSVLHVHIRNTNGEPINQAVVDLYQFKKYYYEYYFYLGTQTTSEDGELAFTLPRIYEDEITQFQLRIAAMGYHDVIKDIMVFWGDKNPEITIIMEGI